MDLRVVVYYDDSSRDIFLEDGEINFHTIRVFKGNKRRDFNTCLSSLNYISSYMLTSATIIKLFKKFICKNKGSVFTRTVDRKRFEKLVKFIFSFNGEENNIIVFEERLKLEFV